MPSSGPRYPGTVTTEVGPSGDNNWTNAGNISADDGTEAQITAATYDTNDHSYRLKAQNFGFTIPAGATIDGIVVEIDRRCFAGSAEDQEVRLYDAAGSLVGDDKQTATAWPGTLTVATYGSSSDKWNASPTPTMVNDADFGVALIVLSNSENTDIGVDFIRVTVHYTETENHNGTVVLTGGGVLGAALTTARNRAQVLTGGGVIPVAFSGAHNAAHGLTGGGVLVVVGTGPEEHEGTVVLTGGGVLIPALTSARSLVSLLTGGGVLSVVQTSARASSDDVTGGGILGIVLGTQRLATVNLTGGGIVIFQGDASGMPLTDLGEVMDAIADAITAAGVTDRAYAYPAETVNPPCVVVGYPDSIDFDVTYNRGADRAELPVYFLVGRVVEKAARDKLATIITGATGIKDVLDGDLGGVVQSLRVMDMRILKVQVSGTDYLAARFNAEVYV